MLVSLEEELLVEVVLSRSLEGRGKNRSSEREVATVSDNREIDLPACLVNEVESANAPVLEVICFNRTH